jgi:catechol 2,3-dioxygenase-like lactoylglutathione lyase family enzyme
MTGFKVTRAGAILGVAGFAASLHFYRDQLGLEVVVGGSRFFCVDPDGYLIEIEEPG